MQMTRKQIQKRKLEGARLFSRGCALDELPSDESQSSVTLRLGWQRAQAQSKRAVPRTLPGQLFSMPNINRNQERTHPTHTNTFRAACLPETSTTGAVCLTLTSDQHLNDRKLILLALAEARANGIDLTEDDIVIDNWTEEG